MQVAHGDPCTADSSWRLSESMTKAQTLLVHDKWDKDPLPVPQLSSTLELVGTEHHGAEQP